MSAQGRAAVARVLAEILAARSPGSTWLPVDRRQIDSHTGTGQTIRRLAAPEHLHPIGFEPVAAVDRRTPDEHAVDASGQKPTPLRRRQVQPDSRTVRPQVKTGSGGA